MKSKKFILCIVCCLFAEFAGKVAAQDHGHLNAGAVSQEPGSKVAFENGADFSPEARYVKTLTFTNAGPFASLYQGNITLTALHARDAFGDPVAGGAATGAFLVAEIVSVRGPAGGEFQFWETNSVSAPAVSVPAGTTNAGFRFELSQATLGAGEPGGDPFGHIHGRRFSATVPGIYTVFFRAMDLSTNGPQGGPIHNPSDIIAVQFEAGVNVAGISTVENQTQVTFAAPAGYSTQLQAKSSLSDPEWVDVGAAVSGNDAFVDVLDEVPPVGTRFYRTIGQAVLP